jgi:hypothetical protein
MTIHDLPTAFSAARAEANERARHSSADCPRRICRYCGKHWQRWPGSRLDGHAVCLVGAEFKLELRKLYHHDPLVTIGILASACEVTKPVVSAWLGRVGRRAGEGAR